MANLVVKIRMICETSVGDDDGMVLLNPKEVLGAFAELRGYCELSRCTCNALSGPRDCPVHGIQNQLSGNR